MFNKCVVFNDDTVSNRQYDQTVFWTTTVLINSINELYNLSDIDIVRFCHWIPAVIVIVLNSEYCIDKLFSKGHKKL